MDLPRLQLESALASFLAGMKECRTTPTCNASSPLPHSLLRTDRYVVGMAARCLLVLLLGTDLGSRGLTIKEALDGAP